MFTCCTTLSLRDALTLLLALCSGVGHSGEAGKATSAKLEKLSTQWMDSMLRKDKVRLEELMAPEFVLHTAHPTYPETPREMWLDNLFNHLVIDKWQQTDIFSGVAGPGEGDRKSTRLNSSH